MIQLDTHIDIIVLLKSKLDDLAGRREKLDGNRFDTVANGDLKLMLEVLRLKRSELSADTLELINKGVSDLCPRLLSN